jgi:elongation factor G
MHADRRTEIESAEAGDLCGVIGLDSVLGETYSSDGFKVALESIDIAEPVLRLSIEPQSREDCDQLVKALDRFRRQDPTFRFWNDAESGQMLIAGMGQLRLQDEYDCKVHVGKPQVAFKERPTRSMSFEYRLKKQNGGPGQFAQIAGRLEVLPMNSENNFEFSSEVSGGRISPPFIQAIREGIEESLTCGPLGSFPVVGVRIVLEDGLEHEKDSSEMSFRRCAAEAMREVVLPRAGIELLEPMVQAEVEVPSQFQGGTVGSLSRKRASISSSNDCDGTCRIIAQVPLAEMLDYANELRSQTQGKGTFSMTPSGYQSAPRELKVDAKRKDRFVASTN